MSIIETPPACLNWERVARAGMHPLAIKIVELIYITDAPMSPREIATELDAPLGVVSYHVRMVRDRGLVVLDRTETRRGALGHWYRLADGVA